MQRTLSWRSAVEEKHNDDRSPGEHCLWRDLQQIKAAMRATDAFSLSLGAASSVTALGCCISTETFCAVHVGRMQVVSSIRSTVYESIDDDFAERAIRYEHSH